MKNLLIVLTLLLFIGIACSPPEEAGTKEAKDSSTTKSVEETSEPATEKVSDTTWKEIDEIYNLVKSKKTDTQKAELWKDYEGKIVEWTGEVSDIKEGTFSGYSLLIKMNKSTLTHDLNIGLDDSQKEKVLKISKGDKVKFRGKLSNWGSILAITLSDGEILE